MHPRPFLLLLLGLALAACGESRDRPPGTPGSATDAGSADAATTTDGGAADGGAAADGGLPADAGSDPDTEPSDLGARCSGGCNLATCVLEDEGCEGGICVWHADLEAAYCSRRCVERCRSGYRCVMTEDDSGPACLSDPPVCGNSTLEFGEVCDDGNTEDGDFCAADCSAETVPPSGGTVTTSFDGREPMTASGDDPVVRAVRQGSRIFFEANTSQVTYGLQFADDDGPAPYTTLLEAGLTEAVGGNLCPYQGASQAQITQLDVEGQQIAGSARFLMVCTGGNCDFGCNREFMLDVQFDLRWIDGE